MFLRRKKEVSLQHVTERALCSEVARRRLPFTLKLYTGRDGRLVASLLATDVCPPEFPVPPTSGVSLSMVVTLRLNASDETAKDDSA